jgi:hypothetical protein
MASPEADKAGTMHLPPLRVRAVTATPLACSRSHRPEASLLRAWRQ